MKIVLYNSSVETFLKIGVTDMSSIFKDGQETTLFTSAKRVWRWE